ncbi:uncharacterized protein LOC26527164 [Drosophila mojavensis]|uniref:Vacuolar ATPase assembly integral membrane protein VMA21 homolog n=1 Tax=Drosophila mojavensis TaxID=7230 RepID=A0A0Q9X9W8_DROMO|nr:uncharacterized protein LOC26527164 [Drosophila mojavensis]KRG00824.1 uncharacterized protein Dmoj_GI25523 [Drosophila mojavensis]
MGKKSKKQSALAVAPESSAVQPEKSEVEPKPEAEQQYVDKSLEVFLWLMAYSVLMFTLPFLGFYGVRSWLEESFPELSTFQVNCYSVLTAVLVVNTIVAMYVLKAVREKDPPALAIEDDDNKKEQ